MRWGCAYDCIEKECVKWMRWESGVFSAAFRDCIREASLQKMR